MNWNLFLGLFLIVFSNSITAKPALDFEVGKARIARYKVAFVNVSKDSGSKLSKQIVKRIQYNLEFADLFEVKPETDRDGEGKVDSININNWEKLKYNFVMKVGVTALAENQMQVTAHVWDLKSKTSMYGKALKGPTSVATAISQQISDQLLSIITSRPSESFYSALAFVCNRNSDKKEIYMTDWDGSYLEQLTKRRSLVFSPSFSRDGRYMVFTSYANMKWGKNLNLYLADLKTQKYKAISQRRGLHIGPSFHPNGELIVVTMSFTGNPQLYLVDRKGKIRDTVAKSWGFNLEADFSPDGKELAFVSGRSGKPMIYLKGINESGNGKRLTFAGRYNSHPMFSPDGSLLLFSSWIGDKFDLFTIKKDKTNLERLTEGKGSNEEAVWSPDGNFIAFTSSRSGKKRVYIMNTKATKIRPLSPAKLGACEQPAWGRCSSRSGKCH